MTRSEGDEGRSIYRLRWVGYGLLLLALFNTIEIFIPPSFMNPGWELQTIGALVEQVPIPLMALVLIFFGESYDRTRLEKPLLKLLSWLCLLLALLFLLLIPLALVNTWRVNDQFNQRINAQSQQQLSQMEQVEAQLATGTPEEIRALATQLNSLGIAIDSQNPEEIKSQILARIPPAKDQLQQQAQAERSSQRLGLLKSSVKWNLGALISSVLLFIIWRGTGWARR
ncbi:HpsJ family protein [Microcoleus sp. FACHB-68]|uniref:HpsJ-like protein, cyanoexosortase A-associated n=1 Tax=Microcoleus sp. FACHB-68 TaxID=2692826 RepID=UPI001686D808|nr:HpsJ family protein [Microcoleus sp. FACHB-68]MBD1937458.1 hypothetical protein [Microcoleus sp. FACHB-68]